MRVFRVLIVMFAILAAWNIYAFPEASAYAITPGAGSGGCCGIPPELEEQALLLEQSFNSTDGDLLLRQRWAGKLCDNHPCGTISEIQAKEFLDDLSASKIRKSDRILAWAGVITGIVAAVAAVLAFLHSVAVDRRTRVANDRSIRNEALLESLREGKES